MEGRTLAFSSRDLMAYFEGRSSPEAVKAAVSSYVDAMRKAKGIRGASIHIHIECLEEELTVRGDHVRRVCDDLLAGSFDAMEVDYLMNCVELCGDFVCESDEVRQAVFELCDPEINGPLTPENVARIQQEHLS